MRKGNANIHNIGRLFSKLIFGAIYCRELLLFASDCRFHRLPVEDFGVFPPDQLRLSFDPYERTWYGLGTEEIRRRYGGGTAKVGALHPQPAHSTSSTFVPVPAKRESIARDMRNSPCRFKWME